MEIKVNKATILDEAKREIFRVADSAYDNEGNSLYDGIITTSRDETTLGQMFSDACTAYTKRIADVVSSDWTQVTTTTKGEDGKEVTTATDEYSLKTDTPDEDTNFADTITSETARYISLNIAAAWFQEKYADKAAEYTARAQAAMDKAVSLLKTRKRHTITRA